MKLVQKTILATAVAVAFAPAAFADVTLSGKAAAEVVGHINNNSVKKANGLENVSDGLEFKLKGDYDIVGDNKAGFALKMKSNKIDGETAKTWHKGAIYHEESYVYVKPSFGKFSFGRQATPTDDIVTDYWDNSAVAGTEDAYYVGLGATADNTIKYTNSFGALDFGFSTSAYANGIKANKNAPLIEDGGDFIYDTAVAYHLGDVTLEAGLTHVPETKLNGVKTDAATSFILGADLENFTATLASTNENKDLSVLLGAKHGFTDVVTGKATVSAYNSKNTATDKKETNVKVALGADYNLAKNVVAHTVIDFKKPGYKKSETATDIAAGLTVKF